MALGSAISGPALDMHFRRGAIFDAAGSCRNTPAAKAKLSKSQLPARLGYVSLNPRSTPCFASWKTERVFWYLFGLPWRCTGRRAGPNRPKIDFLGYPPGSFEPFRQLLAPLDLLGRPLLRPGPFDFWVLLP